MPEPALYSIKQAGMFLGVSQRTVYNLVRNGEREASHRKTHVNSIHFAAKFSQAGSQNAAKGEIRMSDLARTNEHEQMIRSQSAKKMTDKALVSRVKRGFQKIKAELPDILELRERFAAMPRGRANIDGCKTWTEFCEKRLHRTYRQICKVLAENNDTNPTIEVTPTEPEPAPREATKPTPEETTETEQPEPAEEQSNRNQPDSFHQSLATFRLCHPRRSPPSILQTVRPAVGSQCCCWVSRRRISPRQTWKKSHSRDSDLAIPRHRLRLAGKTYPALRNNTQIKTGENENGK